jgi:hypothetical protein
MVHPVRNHTARTATASAKRVKTAAHAKAQMAEKQTVRQRRGAKAVATPQAANEEKFTAPFDPAERHIPQTSGSRAKRHSLQAVDEAEDWKEEEGELDNLLQEGGKVLPEDDY